MKPGGYLVAFGAPRTAHRLAAGIEDAGFELRDTLSWLYGTGVPKARLHQGRSSALKPAHEPIILARKPFHGTLDHNETRWGTGRLAIDEHPDRASAAGAIGRWPCNVVLTHALGCTTARLRQQLPGAAARPLPPGAPTDAVLLLPKAVPRRARPRLRAPCPPRPPGSSAAP